MERVLRLIEELREDLEGIEDVPQALKIIDTYLDEAEELCYNELEEEDPWNEYEN